MDFVGWLESLPPQTLQKLYSSHWACQAVLRGLGPLAKQYVLRMALLEQPLPQSYLARWPASHARHTHGLAMGKLTALQVLLPVEVPGTSEPGYSLHQAFQAQLTWAMRLRESSQEAGVPARVLECVPSREALQQHAEHQWEALQLYLMGAAGPPGPHPLARRRPASLDVDALLSHTGLLELEPGVGSRPPEKTVTEAGFCFLLLDTYTQVWGLLRAYVEGAEQRAGANLGRVLDFLLQTGFRELGAPFPLAALDELAQGIAADLAQLGIITLFKVDGEVWAAGTQLALALAGGGGGSAAREVTRGFIMVETNYRVYAYTVSPLRVATLQLFTRCDCLLPNLYVGQLTRESTTAALGFGLTADQIVDFLRLHAHPKLAGRSPVVPTVVADQLRLWQADTERVRSATGYLYDDFESVELFKRVLLKAKQLGSLLWSEGGAVGGRLVAAACLQGDAHPPQCKCGHEELKAVIRSQRDLLGL